MTERQRRDYDERLTGLRRLVLACVFVYLTGSRFARSHRGMTRPSLHFSFPFSVCTGFDSDVSVSRPAGAAAHKLVLFGFLGFRRGKFWRGAGGGGGCFGTLGQACIRAFLHFELV